MRLMFRLKCHTVFFTQLGCKHVMAALAPHETKSTEDANDSNNENGVNEIGKSIIDSEPGVMWSIGYNGYGEHGNGTKNHVNQLTLHQWAKNLDIVKVVSGMNSVTMYIAWSCIIAYLCWICIPLNL